MARAAWTMACAVAASVAAAAAHAGDDGPWCSDTVSFSGHFRGAVTEEVTLVSCATPERRPDGSAAGVALEHRLVLRAHDRDVITQAIASGHVGGARSGHSELKGTLALGGHRDALVVLGTVVNVGKDAPRSRRLSIWAVTGHGFTELWSLESDDALDFDLGHGRLIVSLRAKGATQTSRYLVRGRDGHVVSEQVTF